MTRKRKTFYPPARTSTRRAPPPGSDASTERPNLATINTAATVGRSGFAVGDRVQIDAAGLYAGQLAVIEQLSNGIIPAAFVRTQTGGSRKVRTIDLVLADTGAPPIE